MRESNIPTPRQAYPIGVGGFCLPFVSLLDDEHIRVELAVVTISPPKGEELRSDRITVRTTAGWQSDPEDDRSYGQHEYNIRRAGNKYDYVENSYIRAVDEGRLGDHAKLVREIVYQERKSSYVKAGADYAKWIAQTLGCVLHDLHHAKAGTARLVKLSKHGSVLTSDTIGRPVEFALYSKMPLSFGERGEKKFWLKRKTLDELAFSQLSGPKPQPMSLPFNSQCCPEMFDWSDNGVPKGLVEHWKGNPKSPPYGPVARLKPAFLAVLQNSKH
jgi:hypothetical protein